MKKIWLLAPLALTLTGCVTPEQVSQVYASQRPATAAERRTIAAYVQNSFFDPYSIRDAVISGVFQSVTIPGTHTVCIYANAKNRMGAYTGRTYTVVRLKGGTVIDSDTSDMVTAQCSDPRVRYVPFAEVMR